MPGKDSGEGESDPKAPLADGEEEEDIGDPVPGNIQAWIALCAFVAVVFMAMGLASSEWVIAEDGNYWQGLFIACAGKNVDGSGSGSGEASEEKSSSSSSSSESKSAETGSGSGSGSGSGNGCDNDDDDSGYGCTRIDLENQGYTMLVAMFVSISMAANLFGFILALLASWVRDIDSKRKSYKLSLYLNIVCVATNLFSLIIYAGCFGEVLEEIDELGPFKNPEDDWSVGWSFQILVAALLFQVITTLLVGYSLLLLPIIEEVEEEEGAGEEEK